MNYIFVRRQSITRTPAIAKGSRVRCEDVYSVLARPIVIRVHKQFDQLFAMFSFSIEFFDMGFFIAQFLYHFIVCRKINCSFYSIPCTVVIML